MGMTTVHVDVINSNDGPLRLIVEPWAREYDLHPGSTTRLAFDGPEPAFIELASHSDRLAIYGWTGSTLDDGVNAVGPPVPRNP
jgi:hypothetical protein